MRLHAVVPRRHDVRWARCLRAVPIYAIATFTILCGLLTACSGGSSGHAVASSRGATSAPAPVTSAASVVASATATPSAAPTTPVAPPTSGGIHSTVASRAVTTQAAVALTATAHFSSSVSVALGSITPVNGKAHLPGEVSGPALSLRIRVANRSGAALDLSNAAVAVVGAGNKPEGQLAYNGSSRFPASLAAGKTATGVYVFTVPVADRSHLQVSISYTAGVPVVFFVGSVR